MTEDKKTIYLGLAAVGVVVGAYAAHTYWNSSKAAAETEAETDKAAEPSERPLVTITGVTGFIGSQIAAVFLKDGNYRVRGTVRSKTNAAKIDPLKAGLGDLFEQLELVEADLLDEASVIKACEGATYVVHPASPF